MKKSIAIAAVAVSLLTSCVKSYSCECTDKTNGVVTGTSNYPVTSTKKSSKTACAGLESSDTSGGITEETTCVLK